MKAHPVGVIAGVGAGLFVALIAFAPASWLAHQIESASGGHLALQTPRGSVWSGSADLVLSGGLGSSGWAELPTRLHWQISPAWLGLDVTLASSCCTPAASPVELGLRASGSAWPRAVAWRVNSQNLQLPAQLLAGLGAPWNTMQLSGQLSLSSNNLNGVWSRTEGLTDMTGQATLEAKQMATALSTIQPLGSYQLSMTGAVMKLQTLSIAPNEPALLLSGIGKIEQGRASFAGEAMAAPGREEALSNLLHIVGQWQPSLDGRSRSILKL